MESGEENIIYLFFL